MSRNWHDAWLVDLHQLTSGAGYAAALAILDELWAVHQACDHDGWLEHSVRSRRALILGEAGDLDGAIARAGRSLRDAQSRFAGLDAELVRLRDDPAARAAAIQLYVAAEPVGWFRLRAQGCAE